MKVYVIGYEPDQEKASVGGFDWFYKKEDADKKFIEQTENSVKFDNSHKVYRGEIEIDDWVTDKDDITDKIDMFLYENDWENAFK